MVIVSESRLSENGLEGLKLAIKKRGRGGGGGVACGRQHMTLTLRQAKCCLLQYVLYLWLEDYALEGSKF